MFIRALALLFLLNSWASFRLAAPVHAAAPQSPTHPIAQSLDELPPLCVPVQQAQPGCPEAGPGAYIEQAGSAGIPYPLPPVDVTAIGPYRGLTPHAYGKVITDTAPVYRHPLEARAAMPPMRRFENGFVFVSVLGTVTVEGEKFYRINPGEYMRATDVDDARPSSYAGQFFAAPPTRPIGWLINTVQISGAPGAAPAADAPYIGRHQAIQPLNAQRVGEWDWYEIAPGQWVEQRNLALVQPRSPVGPDVIAVDTYEQSLGVYRGGNLIFATLVSSGSRAFPTRPGTFSVWAKFTYGRMTGAYFADRRDYYYLEDVPWILYYDGDRALHGAYWHDHFGVRSSHGCVNLAPRDARWLFEFAKVGDAVHIFSSR